MNDFIKDCAYIYGCHIVALSETNARNKARLFDALEAAGITAVTVTFDGYGDNGQIEEVTTYAGEAEAALPETTVTLEEVNCTREVTTFLRTLSVAEAVETLCYGYLAQQYGGWENNDGAFGTFELDVSQRTIELEFNGRFSDYSTTTSSF